MQTRNIVIKKRPDPTLMEIYPMHDKVLSEFLHSFKESISQAVRENISLEDDHASTLYWKSLCARFHILKDLEEYEEKVARLKAELTVDDEEPSVISSYFISHNYAVFNEYDGTQGNIDKGAFKSFFPPDLESFRFETDDSLLASKFSICESFNTMSPVLESFIFNEEAESNLAHCEVGGPPIKESSQSENEIYGCDEIKIPLAKVSCAEILFEKRSYAADFQPVSDSAGVLKDALLNEEEDIMQKFLSSLKPNLSSRTDSGIHLNQVENETLVDESSFQSSMYGFSDLDCGSNAGKCDDTFGKEKDKMHCMLDDNLFLERGGEVIYSKIDSMLDEASLCLRTDHDIESHMKKVSLDDGNSRYCASLLEKVPTLLSFQYEMKSSLMNVEDQSLDEKECYDELWLFGKECLVNIFICTLCLKFSIEEVTSRQWFGAAPLRHDLLLRKGSYFSQPVNGFA